VKTQRALSSIAAKAIASGAFFAARRGPASSEASGDRKLKPIDHLTVAQCIPCNHSTSIEPKGISVTALMVDNAAAQKRYRAVSSVRAYETCVDIR
jgi:hypothetical protein